MIWNAKILMLIALALSGESAAQAGRLDVCIDGISGGGTVNLLLFKSAQGFPDAPQAAVRAIRLPVSGTKVCTDLGALPYGTYAVAVFHDRNANGKLDRYPFGAPREPYGFSNGARGVFSAPAFSKAAFSLNTSRCAVTVRVQ